MSCFAIMDCSLVDDMLFELQMPGDFNVNSLWTADNENSAPGITKSSKGSQVCVVLSEESSKPSTKLQTAVKELYRVEKEIPTPGTQTMPLELAPGRRDRSVSACKISFLSLRVCPLSCY
jgi:hypothetical protein